MSRHSAARVIALAVLGLSLWACKRGEKEEAADTAAPVEVAKVERKEIARVVTADAVLFPVRQAAITPKISAPVRHFAVNRGDHVREGQLLVVLENQDLAATADENKALYEQAQTQYQTTIAGTMPEDLTKARTDLEAAKQALEAARRVYENRVALVKEGALAQKLADDAKVAQVQAQSQYEQSKRHYESLETVTREQQRKGAEDQVQAAKAHWATAAAQLSYSEIHSPISGVVSDRPTYDGEMATSGSPLITIVDISEIVARINVSAADSRELKRGDKATIHAPQGDVEGAVWIVSPSADQASTTVEVWVKTKNTGEKLKPGTTARIEIEAETIPDAIVIPAAALLAADDGGDRVMVVNSGSTAEERKVKSGIRNGDDVQILDGLKPGEEVITVGGLGLEDKAKVRVEKAETKEPKKEE